MEARILKRSYRIVAQIPLIGRILRRIRSILKGNPDRFLRHVSGVIHVGANTGQERDSYGKHGLRVIWIEPNPEVFESLQSNLKNHPGQIAFRYLVTDRDGQEYKFRISNNEGASSSILDLKLHRDIWPEVNYIKEITLSSVTLVSLLGAEGIKPSDYDALILDTQGSELLVLKGAAPLLQHFKYIKTEVPDFESYAGCCQLTDIDAFLTQRGYRILSRHKFAERPQGGSYYDVVYERVA
jgi:FkbM family methyltransferase